MSAGKKKAMKGPITWRKYGLRNMNKGELVGEKEMTCSKILSWGSLSGNRLWG